MNETTLLIIKPDGVQRRLIGEIISRIEKKGYKISGMKLMNITKKIAQEHYKEHIEKSFYPSLEKFITSGPAVVMAVSGFGIIKEMRKMIGSTNPLEAQPGTIRADYGVIKTFNLIHASDSPESAKRELNIFFNENEILSFSLPGECWVTQN